MRSTWVQPDIINEQFLISLKQLIADKYTTSEGPARAAVLANAVHRALDSRLPGFPQEYKVGIRLQLLDSLRTHDRFRITADHVFHQSMLLDMDLPEVIVPLSEWTAKQLGLSEPPEALSEVLRGLKQSGAPTYKLVDLQKKLYSAALFTASQDVAAGSASVSPGRVLRLPVQGLIAGIILLGLFAAAAFSIGVPWSKPFATSSAASMPSSVGNAGPEVYFVPYLGKYNELPSYMKYVEIDTAALKRWLQERNSLLSEELYFDAIVSAARSYNVHPLFLFAITGQEQSFVPRTHPDAKQIANNPFNVFHSWKDYNTNVEDSASIAAATIVKLIEGIPDGENPIKWINRKYAEDPNWWIGVEKLFDQLLLTMPSQGRPSPASLTAK